MKVADFPRPPIVEPSEQRARIQIGGVDIVDTHDVVRVLETYHPPGIYVPIASVMANIEALGWGSICPFKGPCMYYKIEDRELVAWGYPISQQGPYPLLADRVSFYPGKVDACYLDGERVVPQPGEFYGGWITSDLEGPFKGSGDTPEEQEESSS